MPEHCPQCYRNDAWAVLDELGDGQMERAHALLTALYRHNGCETPAENFISNVAYAYARALRSNGNGVTPEAVKGMLPEFEEDFASMVESAKLMARNYPELVLEKTPSTVCHEVAKA